MQYDKKTREVNLKVGNRVMVLMPSAAKGEKRKFAHPFHGPFRVLTVTPTNAEVKLVDDPKADPIFVALDRVCLYHPEEGDVTWTGKSRRRAATRSLNKESDSTRASHVRTGPVMRSMTRANAN